MMRVALTGGIGMGKSVTARLFADEGVAVWDADAAVHRLYTPGGAAVGLLLDRFPEVGDLHGGIDRAELSETVFNDPQAFADLEAIVHPLVVADREAFINAAWSRHEPLVLFDIPLLFETGAADHFDAVIVVSAPEDVRRARVLEREGMTEDKYAAIVARQTPDHHKRQHADFVITTDGGVEHAREQVREILATLRKKAPSKP